MRYFADTYKVMWFANNGGFISEEKFKSQLDAEWRIEKQEWPKYAADYRLKKIEEQ